MHIHHLRSGTSEKLIERVCIYEKLRSMRKLSELYSELRQVHKRLEIDLQHGHNSAEFEAEGVGRSEVQIQTLRRSENRMDRRGENREELEDEGNGIRARTDREGYKEGHRRYEKEHIARCSSTAGSSGPQERLFTIAPKQGPRPGFGHHGRRKNVVAKAGRRRERSENSETATDYEQVENRLTTRPSRTNRR